MGKRYGVIADLHANIEGLTSVLDKLESEGVDEILCLGDIVGYNGSPADCIDTAFEKCSHVIKGNHDRYLFGQMPEDLRENIVHSVEWGRDNISADQLVRLRNCPDHEVVDDLLLIVHGSPRNKDEYLLSYEAISENFKTMKSNYLGLDVCFYGHTHLPFLIGGGLFLSDITEHKTVELDRLTTYLINPGSSGQPRDGCTKASCGVFDSNDWSMTFLRIDYDVKSAQSRVVEAGLDSSFAYRLEIGR